MGICPGAEAPSPIANDSDEPNTPPTIRVATPSGPIDMLMSGMRAFASAMAVAASSVMHVGAVARHRGDLGHVGAEPVGLEEPLDEDVAPGRVAEVVVREDEARLVLARALAHAPHRRRRVGELEVEEIDEAGTAHRVVEPRHAVGVERVGLPAFVLRAAGEDDRRLARGCTHRAPGREHGRGVGDGLEEVDAPLDHVGTLREHRGGLGREALGRARHQRRADERRAARPSAGREGRSPCPASSVRLSGIGPVAADRARAQGASHRF